MVCYYFLFLFFEDDIFGLLYKEYILFFVDQVLFESRYVFSYGYILLMQSQNNWVFLSSGIVLEFWNILDLVIGM